MTRSGPETGAPSATAGENWSIRPASRCARHLHDGSFVTLASLLLAATALASTDAPDPGLGAALSTERLALPARFGAIRVAAEEMGARITLFPEQDAAGLRRHLAHAHAELCPTVTLEGGAVLLTCRVRTLQARLIDGPQRALEIRQMAGLPWSGEIEGPPLVFYPPEQLGLGKACPGDTLEARAECALHENAPQAALAALRAVTHPTSGYVGLRLGDLALRTGAVGDAAAAWKRTLLSDPFGRMARARLCELDGSCLGTSRESSVFDSGGLPEPLRSELELRHARALVFTGRIAEAAALLRARMEICTLGALLCQAMVLEMLRSPDAREVGLDIYFALPERTEPPLGSAMARAAASAAAAAGAPLFGAKVLAGTVSAAGPDELQAHLTQAAELFLEVGDRARARVILEYARSRIGDRRFALRPWSTLWRRLGNGTPAQVGPLPALTPGLEQDLASAEAALKKARGESTP